MNIFKNELDTLLLKYFNRIKKIKNSFLKYKPVLKTQ